MTDHRIVVSGGRTLVSAPFGNGYRIASSCAVRNELNGERPLHDPSQVVDSMNADGSPGKPYMPRPFPVGIWPVRAPYKPTPEDDPDNWLGDWFTPTDAHQTVTVWALDERGGYDHPTNETIEDWGYGVHYSRSETTDGCLRIDTQGDDDLLVKDIAAAIQAGDTVSLEVLDT